MVFCIVKRKCEDKIIMGKKSVFFGRLKQNKNSIPKILNGIILGQKATDYNTFAFFTF